MIKLVRSQLKKQLIENHEAQNTIDEVDGFLDDKTLIIGFARRFATYKRATLIFHDLKRLQDLINNKERPVAFVFAGKAHPQDLPGQKFIEDIYKYSRMPEFKGKIIILENYDMNISRHLIAGSDVWLNNPRRPLEASGTSGQKVPINFGLNFSVLDGWWREAFNGQNGWAIGKDKDYQNDQIQDHEDAIDFYHTLEQIILPLYYADKHKDEHGASDSWIEKAKISFASNISHYSTHRMVQEYMTKFYAKAIDYGEQFGANPDLIKTYFRHRHFLKKNWSMIYFSYFHIDGSSVELPSEFDRISKTPLHHVDYSSEMTFPGRVFKLNQGRISIGVNMGDINPLNIVLEAVIFDDNNKKIGREKFNLKGPLEDGVGHYELLFKSNDLDFKTLRFRVFGYDTFLAHPFEYGNMFWY